jgi:RimJ/RimL family protein N-acetyltransferase
VRYFEQGRASLHFLGATHYASQASVPAAAAQSAVVIHTARLELRPATAELLHSALAGPMTLAEGLGAVVPASWPPDYLDAPALQYSLDRLTETPSSGEWWMYFVLLRPGPAPRTLIGSAGYKGPPDAEGTVEIGYGIVAEHRRRGYATEAAQGLVTRALGQPGTRRIIAETLPELAGSIGVLTRCGFVLRGEGSEPGVIRFELANPSTASRPSLP